MRTIIIRSLPIREYPTRVQGSVLLVISQYPFLFHMFFLPIFHLRVKIVYCVVVSYSLNARPYYFNLNFFSSYFYFIWLRTIHFLRDVIGAYVIPVGYYCRAAEGNSSNLYSVKLINELGMSSCKNDKIKFIKHLPTTLNHINNT